MARIAVGRATFFVAVSVWGLSQAAVGCGSAATPNDATGTGGSGAGSGAADEGGSTTAEGGSPGDTGGRGESGSPGESGGAGGAGSGGRGGAGGGGQANFGGKASSGGGGLGKASGGGSSGFGNFSGSGGAAGRPAGGSGGTFSGTGGKASGGTPGTGGMPACVAGKPCKCEALVGTVECDKANGETCACPSEEACENKVGSPCFEPCGGDPFGAWVLADACFAATTGMDKGACEQLIEGKSGDSDLRLRILDGGDMQIFGSEDWSIQARVSLSCLGIASVNSCALASHWSQAMLFSSSGVTSCAANACGVCDCAGDLHGEVGQFFGFERWSRSGTNLRLGSTTAPYCVKGDELWIGGTDSFGTPKVSYKFKKQSCTGTPLPCASRTAEQCALGCNIGVCKATTGTLPRCGTAFSQDECSVLQGCTWDPSGCAGSTSDSCQFENCDMEPGCTWGPPKARCGGYAFGCEAREVSQCAGEGCSVRVCQPNFSEVGECQLLTAVDCAKAPGCVVSASTGLCTGQTLCSAQTDAVICGKLGSCFAQPNCGGTPTQCSTLSVDACQSVLGCRTEW